jgi:hypothetical protein
LAQRHRGTRLTVNRWQHDRKRAEDVEVPTLLARQANHDVETAIAIEDLPGLPTRHSRGHRISHFLDRQAIAGDCGAIEDDVEGRETAG